MGQAHHPAVSAFVLRFLAAALVVACRADPRARSEPSVHPTSTPSPRPAETPSPDLPPTPTIPDDARVRLDAIATALKSEQRDEARALLRAAMADPGWLQDLDDAVRALVLTALDTHAGQLGELEIRLAAVEQLVALRREHPGTDALDLAEALQRLCGTLHELRDHAGAREAAEEVLRLRTDALPAEDVAVLSARQNLAALNAIAGDLQSARDQFAAIVETLSRAVAPEHPALLAARLNLAQVSHEMGDLVRARELEEDVLAIRLRILTEDHEDLCIARGVLSNTLADMGDLEGARALQEQVLAARTRQLPADHPDVLDAQANLAVLRKNVGDYLGARVLEEHVLATGLRIYPEDHPDLLAAKHNLAATLDAQGELDGARKLLEQVLEARERSPNPDSSDAQGAKHNLALVLLQQGELAEAVRLLREVVAAREVLLPPDHPALVNSLQSLAILLARTGALDESRAIDREVLERRERLLPPGHRDLVDARLNLAVGLREVGPPEDGRARLLALLQEMRALARNQLWEAPRVAREAARGVLEDFSSALFLADNLPPDRLVTRALFETLEELRRVSTSSSAVARAAYSQSGSGRIAESIRSVRNQMNDLVVLGPFDDADTAAWRAEIHRLSSERDALERELRGTLAASGLHLEGIDASALAGELGPKAAAISYLRHDAVRAEEIESEEENPREARFSAFVLRADGDVDRVDLGPAKEIEDLARSWRSALGAPLAARGLEPRVERGDGAEAERIGTLLCQRILEPLLARTNDARRIVICPDGALNLVPLAILPRRDGIVGDGFDIQVEVSFARLLDDHAPRAASSALVVLGGIDYGGAEDRTAPDPAIGAAPSHEKDLEPATRSSALHTEFDYLPGSLLEARAIAALFAQASSDPAFVLLGADATKSAVRDAGRRARYLHVATHGWFAPEATSARPDGERQERADTVRGFAPETLCGLALAGASLGRDALGRVPGILTAEELAGLDLSGCELAVLSACETNVGITRAGQGIQSLQGALHAAGARTAITSLWKVDDEATRELFEDFYARIWIGGEAKSRALWGAQMAQRAKGRPARDWGGWVLTGDPR